MTTAPMTSFEAASIAWQIDGNQYDAHSALLQESLFSLANGYVGTRGTLDESSFSAQDSCEGTYINGLFFQEKIAYGEISFGNAINNDRMLQVPDGKAFSISVNGQRFSPCDSDDTALNLGRVFDMKSATLTRRQLMVNAKGQQLLLQSQRFVSLANKHLIAIEYQITPLNFSANAQVYASLDAGYQSIHSDSDPRAGELDIKKCLSLVSQVQTDTKLSMLHRISGQDVLVCSTMAYYGQHGDITSQREIAEDDKLAQTSELSLTENVTTTIEKFIHYSHNADSGSGEQLRVESDIAIAQAATSGYQQLMSQHQQQVSDFWQSADIEIVGDPLLQQGMRFNLLHLFMSVGKDGHSNIGAKGLTGPGYDGHYFWDSEIYILPFLIYTQPQLARDLLSFRFNTLDKARNRARDLAHATGALFPWRTIGGDECSAFFPAGTAQYHINAAVAYGIRSYFNATDDWAFMQEQGAEMLFETARIWSQMGHFSAQHNGEFCIHEVTGPDEYTAMVNNNFYTNAMAKLHLGFAVEIAHKFQAIDQVGFDALCDKISLSKSEVTAWQQAEQLMHLPYDETLGVSPQDDSFLSKPKWDTDNTPAEKFPLLIHFHPLVIYRHQVLKQADVVLAMFLLDDQFDLALKKRNLDYYEPLTTHDSTLSACIHSIEYAETGDYQRAYEFFDQTVRMDLDDNHGNSGYGLHTASMAGSWLSIVQGFAGMRVRHNRLHFKPVLPAQWQQTTFKMCFRGRRLSVTLSPTQTDYQLLDGQALTIFDTGREFTLSSDSTVTIQREISHDH